MYLGADESSRFLSMSVAKSFTPTLLGIARGEGLLAPWVSAKEEESWALFEAISDWVRREQVRHVDDLN